MDEIAGKVSSVKFKLAEANFAVMITEGINVNALILANEEWCSSYSEGGLNNATVQINIALENFV